MSALRLSAFRSLSGALALLAASALVACGTDAGAERSTTPVDGAAEASVTSRVPQATDGTSSEGSERPLLGEIVEYPINETDHVLGEVAYQSAPATGGDHFWAWQNCGFYDAPLIEETAVHSLEHGAVWVTYPPGADDATLAPIRERASQESHLLVSPYPGLDAPLVLSAWERQLKVDSWENPAVEEFLDGHLGRRSPTAPEAGASCEGGVGAPPSDPNSRYDEIRAQIEG